MREVLSKLEQVQEIDVQINALLAKKAEFPKRLSGYEAEMKTSSDKANEKKKIVDELEKARRQQLGALELNEERSKRAQEKSEQIKTNQEFQAIQKELESLKKNSAVIQDNANKVTEELEKHRKELDGYEATLKDSTAKRDAEAAKIAEESKVFDVQLAELGVKRNEAIAGIEKRYLATYDKVRQTRNGVGLAIAAQGTCRGCNMRIPPQIYNELQRGNELYTCPSCRRILIFKDAPKINNMSTSA